MSLTPGLVRNTPRYTCTVHQSSCDCKELWVIDKQLVTSVATANNIPTAPVTLEEAQSVDHRELIKGFPRRLISSFIQQNRELPTSLSLRLRNLAIHGTPLREPTLPKHLPLTAPIPNQVLALDVEMSLNGDHNNPEDDVPRIELDLDENLGEQLDALDDDLTNSLADLDTAMKNTDALASQLQNLGVDDIPDLSDVPLPPIAVEAGASKTDNMTNQPKASSFAKDLPGQHYNREINSYLDEINYMLDHNVPDLIEKDKLLDDFCDLLEKADDALEDIVLKGRNLPNLVDQTNAEMIAVNLNTPIMCRLNDIKSPGYATLKTAIRAIRYLMNYMENGSIERMCHSLDRRLDPLVKPLHDLSDRCRSLDITNVTINQRIENLETNLTTMQNILSSLTVQLTTLNQTIAHLKFEKVKSDLVSDIPTTPHLKPREPAQSAQSHEPTEAISLAELLMFETCAFTKLDIQQAEKYLLSFLTKYPTLEGYIKSARALSRCSVPDHYLLGCCLALQDSYKEQYKQTLAHVNLLYTGDWSDKAKVREFMIKMLTSDMAKMAGKSDKIATDSRFSGCPPETKSTARKPVSFLDALGI